MAFRHTVAFRQQGERTLFRNASSVSPVSWAKAQADRAISRYGFSDRWIGPRGIRSKGREMRVSKLATRSGIARLAALAIVIGAGALMLGVLERRPFDRSASRPLRIGISPWPGYETAALAERLGFYDDAGVQVRFVEFSSLSDSRRAFERGQVDGFFGTIPDLLAARSQGMRDPRICRIVDASQGGDRIVGSARVPDALTRGAGHPIVFTTAEIPNEVLDVLVVDAAVLRSDRARVRRFLDAFDRAGSYTRSYPNHAIALMASRTGIAPNVLGRTLRDEIVLFDEREQAELIRSGLLNRIIARHLGVPVEEVLETVGVELFSFAGETSP